MVEEWIEEFLYRGRPPSGAGADLAPAWHVVIGQQADNPFGGGEKSRRLLGPMPIAQAEEAGWPINNLVSGLNEEAVKRVNELEGVVADQEQLILSLQAQLSEAQAALEIVQNELAAAASVENGA